MHYLRDSTGAPSLMSENPHLHLWNESGITPLSERSLFLTFYSAFILTVTQQESFLQLNGWHLQTWQRQKKRHLIDTYKFACKQHLTFKMIQYLRQWLPLVRLHFGCVLVFIFQFLLWKWRNAEGEGVGVEAMWEGDDGGVFWRGISHSSPLYGSLREVTDRLDLLMNTASHPFCLFVSPNSLLLFPFPTFSTVPILLEPVFNLFINHIYICIKKNTNTRP